MSTHFQHGRDEDNEQWLGRKQPQSHGGEEVGGETVSRVSNRHGISWSKRVTKGSGRYNPQHHHREPVEQQGALDQRTREKTIRQRAQGPASPTRREPGSLEDEALRLPQVGRAQPGGLQAEGVGSEDTWDQRRPLAKFSDGASPPCQSLHVHSLLRKLKTALRQTRAESLCADGGQLEQPAGRIVLFLPQRANPPAGKCLE
ncbi:hypothetical protein Efla_001882 [Eimeria flavescens]